LPNFPPAWRQVLLRDHVDRNAAAVVLDGARSVLPEDDRNLGCVAGERFVDRIVDRFVHELVEAAFRRVSDIHAGTLANGLEAF
jgi:hypothetical protein